MIMIIAIIFLYYVIFDEQSKITFRKSSKKIHPNSSRKFRKLQIPTFCQHWKFFRAPLQKTGKAAGGGGWGGRSVYGTGRKSSSNPVNSKSINQSKICLQMFDWVLNTYTSEFDNKDSRTTSFMLFLCFYCWLWIIFVHWFSCIFDMSHKFIFHCFGQVNNIWERF